MRNDERKPKQLRPLTLETGVLDYAEGSCLVTMGKTRVLCAASVEKKVPRWMADEGRGWITAEYNMLPRSNRERSRREGRSRSLSGRTQEIQRLIGRSLRSIVDLSKMPGVQVTCDCDVIQADGGTRTASITGAFVALVYALRWAVQETWIPSLPFRDYVAAVSVGKVDGQVLLDLDYSEDSTAEVDANFVLTGKGGIVEIQGTAEGEPFTQEEFLQMLSMAKLGVRKLVEVQKKAIPQRIHMLGSS